MNSLKTIAIIINVKSNAFYNAKNSSLLRRMIEIETIRGHIYKSGQRFT